MSILEISAQDTLPERFAAKVDTTDGCWLWTGFVDKAGYARLHDNGKSTVILYAHSYSYELHVGPIPEGLTIDHLCRVRRCVNPAHLEPVTARENILRGESPAAKAIRRATCRLGHPYDVVTTRGGRRCRRCDAAGQRRRYHLRRAA